MNYRSHKRAAGFKNKQGDSSLAGFHCSHPHRMQISGLCAPSFPCGDPWQASLIDPSSFEATHGLRSLLNTVFHETTTDWSELENKRKPLCKQPFVKHQESIFLLSLLIRSQSFWERESKTHSEGHPCSPMQGEKTVELTALLKEPGFSY